jgi:hypothetical protein
MMSPEARQKRGSTQDPSGKTMAPRLFDVKFPYGTHLTFGSLTFAIGEDGDLKMLPPGPAPEHVLWHLHRHQADPAQEHISV